MTRTGQSGGLGEHVMGGPVVRQVRTGFFFGEKGMDTDVILKRFEHPDEVREFPKGKFELVSLGGMTICRAT